MGGGLTGIQPSKPEWVCCRRQRENVHVRRNHMVRSDHMTKQSAEIAGTRDAKDTTSFVSAMFIGANMTRRRGSCSNVHGTGVVMGGGSTMSRFTLTLSEKKIDWLIYYSPKIVPGSGRYHARRWHLYAFHNSKIHVIITWYDRKLPRTYICACTSQCLLGVHLLK